MQADDKPPDRVVGDDGELLEAMLLPKYKKKKRSPLVKMVFLPFRISFWLLLILFSGLGIVTAYFLLRNNAASTVRPVSASVYCQLTIAGSTANNALVVLEQIQNHVDSSIYIMDIDGSNVRYITDIHDIQPDSPVISPDGRTLLFERWDNANKIMIKDLETLTERYVTEGIQPNFSPDGQQIVFAANRNNIWNIRIVNSDGSHDHSVGDAYGLGGSIQWSPDGKSLVVSAMPTVQRRNSNLFVLSIDGKDRKQITGTEKQDLYPSWSPDGATIAYNSDSILAFIHPDGTDDVATQVRLVNGGVTWLNSGKQLAFKTWDQETGPAISLLDVSSLSTKPIYHCH